jgi:hypothetical protein
LTEKELDKVAQAYNTTDFVEEEWVPDYVNDEVPVDNTEVIFDENGNPIFKFWAVMRDFNPLKLIGF